MDNACKFSSDKTVTISILTENGQLEIDFKDNVLGLPPTAFEQVFAPFFRAENVHGKVKGHGIGLSLCKSIVELHDGKITFQSELSKGSHFKICLPIQQF